MLSGLENPVHILMVFAVALLLFGAKRIPEVGRSLGSGLREFRSSVTGESPPGDHALPSVANTSVATTGSEARLDA